MKRPTLFLVGLTAVVGFLLGLVFSGSRGFGDARSALARPVAAPPPSQPLQVSSSAATMATVGVDFSVVAARVNGAVVNIDAASRGLDKPQSRRYQRDTFDDD